MGSYLAPALEERGHEVFGIALENDRWLEADLRDRDALRRAVEIAQPDWVFHLAAQSSTARSWEDPAYTYEVNVTGTHNLLDALRAAVPGCRVVISGTSDGYGIVKPDECPLSEEHPLRPVSPYAASKVAQESVSTMFHSAFDMNVIVARAFMHVGPGQAPSFATAGWAQQIARIEGGLQEPVLRVGNLDLRREFCDVRDVIAAYIELMEHGEPGEVYNVSSGEAHALGDALDLYLQRANVEIEVRVDPNLVRPADPPILSGDPSKIERATGWRATRDFHETLPEVLEHWREVTARP